MRGIEWDCSNQVADNRIANEFIAALNLCHVSRIFKTISLLTEGKQSQLISAINLCSGSFSKLLTIWLSFHLTHLRIRAQRCRESKGRREARAEKSTWEDKRNEG